MGRGPGVWQGSRKWVPGTGGDDGEGEGEGEGDERSAESGGEEQEDEMSLEVIVPNQHAIALFAGFLVVVINAHIAVTCRGNTSLVQFSSDSSHHCIRQLS